MQCLKHEHKFHVLPCMTGFVKLLAELSQFDQTEGWNVNFKLAFYYVLTKDAFILEAKSDIASSAWYATDCGANVAVYYWTALNAMQRVKDQEKTIAFAFTFALV